MLFSWRRFRQRATAVLHLDEEPSRLAAAMAVGVFIGITPLYGLHTFLALLAAFVFRLNKAATVTGAWINLPWFAPFVYAFCLRLGESVLSGDWSGFSLSSVHGLARSVTGYLHASPRETAGTLWQMVWDMLFSASMPLLVGTTIVGTVLGVIAYFVALEAVRDIRRLRARMHAVHAPAPGETGRTP